MTFQCQQNQQVDRTSQTGHLSEKVLERSLGQRNEKELLAQTLETRDKIQVLYQNKWPLSRSQPINNS